MIDPVHVVIMALAVATGLCVRQWVKTPSGLSRSQSIAIGLAAFFGGVIGAKLPYLFESVGTLQTFDIWLSDARTITWALGTGYIAVELCKVAVGVTTKTGDGFAAPVAASIAVGRLGCLQGGCCYGLPTTLPWGIDFGDGLARHPTQLYEATFHALAAVGLIWLNREGLLKRQHFKLYLGSYCLYRFVTEWLRPEPAWLWGMTFYQVSVLVIFLGMVLHFAWDARGQARLGA